MLGRSQDGEQLLIVQIIIEISLRLLETISQNNLKQVKMRNNKTTLNN